MKNLFLTSSIGTPGVADSIRSRLPGTAPLKTAFITTPVETKSEQEDLSWLDDDKNAMRRAGFDFFEYTITDKNEQEIRSDLAGISVLYISGGNTNYLLYQSQQCNFAEFVREFVSQGGIYVSTSAGSIIAGPTLPPYLWNDHDDSPAPADFIAYGMVSFTVVPHWGSTWFRDVYLHGRIEQIYNPHDQPYILLNDSQYIEVRDTMYRIVDAGGEQ